MSHDIRQSSQFRTATLARTATGTFITFPKLSFVEPEAGESTANPDYVEITLLDPQREDDDLGWTRDGMMHVHVGKDDFDWLIRSIRKLSPERSISFRAEVGEYRQIRTLKASLVFRDQVHKEYYFGRQQRDSSHRELAPSYAAELDRLRTKGA